MDVFKTLIHSQPGAVGSNVAITGGSVNGTNIGATTPGTGAFTTVTATSVTGPTTTDLTLSGGSSGASLVLGQGANGAMTLTPAGTGRLVFNGALTSNGADFRYDSSSAGGLSVQNRTDGTAAVAQLLVGTASNSIYLQQFPAGFTTSGSRIALSGRLRGEGTLSMCGQSGVAVWSGNDGSETRVATFSTAGNFLVGGTGDISGSGGLKVFGTTAASNTTTGAFQVAGGAGIAGSVHIGGSLVTATSTPASASATGTAGTITWDSNYIYVCTATNTWKRVAIATW